jgi:hypothetical protein
MEKRSRQERQRTLKTGKIIFNHHGSVVDCTVRNMSETGACLHLQSVAGIPKEFDLMIDGVRRSCTVKWRTPSRIGIAFPH